MDFENTVENVGKAVDGCGVAVIVGIRTFLSLSLQVELEGRLPWQARPTAEG